MRARASARARPRPSRRLSRSSSGGLDDDDHFVAAARWQLAQVALGQNGHVEDDDGVSGRVCDDRLQFGVDGRGG